MDAEFFCGGSSIPIVSIKCFVDEAPFHLFEPETAGGLQHLFSGSQSLWEVSGLDKILAAEDE